MQKKHRINGKSRDIRPGLSAIALALIPVYASALSTGRNIADVPLYFGQGEPPMVMLDISKDHQFYYKAYNDYSDLDGNGSLETGYQHAFDYYGYFDSYKCYSYDGSKFSPVARTADKYCTAGNHQWSGNFLNWMSMSRMDVVRKVLYGGKRSIDSTSQTVLERAFIPTDAHSWVKYYNGSDLNRLTPFSNTTAQQTTASSQGSKDIGAIRGSGNSTDITFNTSSGMSLGDQIEARINGSDPSNRLIGTVTGVYNGTIKVTVHPKGALGSGQSSNWTLINHSTAGASFCNTTYVDGRNQRIYSQTVNAPPLIRVAQGNYSLWTANERVQCHWRDEANATGNNNSNDMGRSGIGASRNNPEITRGLRDNLTGNKADYIARVEACRALPALIVPNGLSAADQQRYAKANTDENCQAYGNTQKPVGLLQQYSTGSNPLVMFGLMTGSYDRNTSGGVLRKNIGNLNDEVNSSTGQFTASTGIIATLDRLRLYGYRYQPNQGNNTGDGYIDGTSNGDNGDNCSYQLTTLNDGSCSNWGNPLSELYLESLRYLAGTRSPMSGFSNRSGYKDAALGLSEALWKDPLRDPVNNGQAMPWCSPMNVVLFNASTTTYDSDLLATMSSVPGIASLRSPRSTTDFIGQQENLQGKVIVGSNGSNNDGMCTAKDMTTLGQLAGICPGASSQQGTYLGAGLAYMAHIDKIRTDFAVPNDDFDSLRVNTFGVQLATNIPNIPVRINAQQTVTITPSYQLDRGANNKGTGTLVDFRVITQVDRNGDGFNDYGKFLIQWEDSNQGGDYDQDIWGTIEYEVQGNKLMVATYIGGEATENAQGFGFSISGTQQDGLHFFSGIDGKGTGFRFSPAQSINVYADDGNDSNLPLFDTRNDTKINGRADGNASISSSGGCNPCNENDTSGRKRYAEFDLGSNTATTLKDPLYYMAKWGGFKDARQDNHGVLQAGDNLPGTTAEWDSKNANGAAIHDGLPDNYFYVTNPGNLANSLQQAFAATLKQGSVGGASSNSSSLQQNSVIYQSKFNPNDWSGSLQAIEVGSTGTGATISWSTDTTLTNSALSPSSRTIYTWVPSLLTATEGEGRLFHFNQLNSNQQAIFNADGNGAARVDYLRGVSSNEGGLFRKRADSKLGDIINSAPTFVNAKPNGQYEPPTSQFRMAYINDGDFASFRASVNRPDMLYIGANDGMLHGINASNGTEVMAYVPNEIQPKLVDYANPGYQHRYSVDAVPTVADVKFGQIDDQHPHTDPDNWHTVLVSGLGAGGRGLFALDVTDPTRFDADKVLWEFTKEHDKDLGYTFSKPVIAKVRTNNGYKWAAIFGSGYPRQGEAESSYNASSTNGASPTSYHAQLFVLFIEDGIDGKWRLNRNYFKIDTQMGDTSQPNGLSNIVAFDSNLDGVVDYIYGGDLLGNLWKFDLTNNDGSQWKVAYGSNSTPAPLITVCSDRRSQSACQASVQPIFSKPTFSYTPSGYDKVLVYFGTGKLFEHGDFSSSNPTQTMYGVVDYVQPAAGFNGHGLLSSIDTSSGQVTQTITPSDPNAEKRELTSLPANWNDARLVLWKEDLPAAGEIHVGTPRLFNKRLVYSTLIPNAAVCSNTEATSYLMAVDFSNGGRTTSASFDADGNGQFEAADTSVSGVQTNGAIAGVTVIPGSDNPGAGFAPTLSGSLKTVPVNVGPGDRQRVGWRELFR